MDYKRIYSEFIKDRLGKQPERPDYFERHHIVPRAFGGSNDPDNLVRLTAEDHIFAHLLLAKAHGGSQWVAIIAMFGNWARTETPTRRELRIVAMSRERHGKAMMGEGNSFYGKTHTVETLEKLRDATEYELRHSDGRQVIGNRFELEASTGVPRQQISAILRGAKISAHGWYYPPNNPDGLTRSERLSLAMRKPGMITVHHLNGRKWRGTRWQFHAEFGAKLDFQREDGGVLGWYKTPEYAAAQVGGVQRKAAYASASRGDISGSNNPMAGSDRRKDLPVNLVHKSGEKFSGSLKSFADGRGIDPVTYGRMRKTLMGKKIVDGKAVKTFWGWAHANARGA